MTTVQLDLMYYIWIEIKLAMQPLFSLVYAKQIRLHQYQQRFMELWFYVF